MRYRVIIGYKIYKFSSYADAFLFKLKNGGVLYEKVFDGSGVY